VPSYRDVQIIAQFRNLSTKNLSLSYQVLAGIPKAAVSIQGEARERFIRAPAGFVRFPEMPMSPEAGSCGLVGTRPAAAAYSEAHFDDLGQPAVQKDLWRTYSNP